LAAICFCTGGAMELFMIKTGFYEKVTEIEAQRRQELREQAMRLQAEVAALREKERIQKPPAS